MSLLLLHLKKGECMARLNDFSTEQVELLRGLVDFYYYKGQLPVARSWPRKPKPPYTKLQAEAMAIFSLASAYTSMIDGLVLEWWKFTSEGVRQQWTDTFKGLAMKYWKKTGNFPYIVLDLTVEKNVNDILISWKILKTGLNISEEVLDLETDIINYPDLLIRDEPIWFTLLDNEGLRQISPFFLLRQFI